jgi:urea transport system substrate-binding protein
LNLQEFLAILGSWQATLRKGKAMDKTGTEHASGKRGMVRRTALKGGVAALAAGIGFPAILKATDKVKLGFMTALTGLETILGETQLNCFKLAVEEINAAGGAGGREIEYLIEDDQTTTKVAIEKARKLVFQDKVDAVVGMITSLERIAALSVTGPAKKLLIYTAYHKLGECNKYLVCTGQVPNQQINPMMPWLVKNLGTTVYVMGSGPRKSTDALKAALEAHGGRLVGAEFFPFGTQDLGPAFGKMKDANPEVLWLMFAGSDAITSVKHYSSFPLKPRLVYHGWDETFLKAVSPAEQAGIVASQAYFETLENPANKAFVAHYREKFGKDKPINAIGEATYDAVWLYAKAVAKAGSTEDDKVVAAISKVDFQAPQGHVNISARNNHMLCNSILARVTDQASFEIMENFGQIEPQVPGSSLA